MHSGDSRPHLPPPLQTRGGRGRGQRHVGLQRRQRGVVRSEPPAAHLDPQGRLGLRRVRGERLGLRHPRRRRGRQRRTRSGDACPHLHRRPGGPAVERGVVAQERVDDAALRLIRQQLRFALVGDARLRSRARRLRRAPRLGARSGHQGHRAAAERECAGLGRFGRRRRCRDARNRSRSGMRSPTTYPAAGPAGTGQRGRDRPSRGRAEYRRPRFQQGDGALRGDPPRRPPRRPRATRGEGASR